jgi:hypothetical protein
VHLGVSQAWHNHVLGLDIWKRAPRKSIHAGGYEPRSDFEHVRIGVGFVAVNRYAGCLLISPLGGGGVQEDGGSNRVDDILSGGP